MSSPADEEWPDAALVLALVSVHAWLVLEPAFFLQDDFLNFLQVTESYRSPFHFLARADFGRFAPTHRAQHALLWVLGGGAPSWPVTRGALAALQAASALGAMRFVRPWASRGWAVVVGLGWGLSLAPTLAGGWLAASLHVTTALVCSLAGLVCARTFVESGRWRSLAFAASWWVAALGAYEKTLVLVPSFWVLEALSERGAPRRRWFVAAGLFGLLGASFVGLAWLRGMSQPGSLFRRELLDGVWFAASQTWPELVVGVPHALGWVLTAAFVLATVVLAERRGRALGLWVLAAGLALVLVAPAAAKRIDELGAGWASERRYFLEWWLLFLVVGSLAIANVRASQRSRLVAAAAMVLVVLAPGHHLMGRRTVEALHAPSVREWVTNALAAHGTPVEAEVPNTVVEPWYWPYSSAPRLLRAFGRSPAGPWVRFDASGRAIVVEWQPFETRSLADELSEVTCERSTENGSSCFHAGSRSCWFRWSPSREGELRIPVRSAERACVDWVLEPSNGFGVDGLPRCEPIRGALGFRPRAATDFGGLTLRSMDVHLRPGGRLCVEEAMFGQWREVADGRRGSE